MLLRCCLTLVGVVAALTIGRAADKPFPEQVNPFLDKYCNSCHNSDRQAGGVPLDIYTSLSAAEKDRKVWETIHRVVVNGEMPPKRKAQPSAAEKAAFLTVVDKTLIQVDCVTGPKNPGRVTLRRVNRTEYNNTVRDLCGIDFTPADDFPSDDVGYGFDNIGDVLSLPPILMEKYLVAADRVLDKALSSPAAVKPSRQTFKPQNLRVEPRSSRARRGDLIELAEPNAHAFLQKFHFPATGEYKVEVEAHGRAANDRPPQLLIEIDGRTVGEEDIWADDKKPKVVELVVRVESGDHMIAVRLGNSSKGEKLKKDSEPRMLGVKRLTIEGPNAASVSAETESMRRILVVSPTGPADERSTAEAVVKAFARRAFRRPVTQAEVQRMMTLYDLGIQAGEPYLSALKLPLKAVLVSPHFLFRVEPDPVAPAKERLLNEHELATRLSYFLWASMPDETLLSLADRNQLRKPGVLEREVKRMLADPRSSSMVENFAGQWLQLRMLKTLAPDTETFKNFDENLRTAMIRETELFFDHIVKNDRSILEFLNADYTFLNDRLSWHYGIPDIKGPEFRLVQLPPKRPERGGLVTQASVLTVTSNPTRTSPVKRGKWVYENILGLQAPEVPEGVPELPEGPLKGTLRQQLEQHRADPSCAGCHAKLDPLGFGLENYDAIGGYRWEDNKIAIDASGVLPDGASFKGSKELREVLLDKADLFRKCLAEKLLTYALGRGLEYYDKCLLDDVSLRVKAKGDRFSALVLAIVQSDAFQKRKGVSHD